MKAQKLQNAPMRIVGGFKASELKSDEFSNPQLPRLERFKPALKFGQVLWFYRLPDFEAGNFGVIIDGTRVVAVI